VEYPVLKKLGKQNIRRFLKDRTAYEREISERKNQAGTTYGKPVSLVFSIDQHLLESLVDLRQLGAHITTVKDVKEADIRKWLEAHQEV
jgi:hypothetical protein